MRPVHQPAQLVPFVHAANADSIAQPHGHPLRQVDIVRDQERAMIPDINDKSLMPGAVVVVAKQTLDETGNLNPVARIVFRQCAVRSNFSIPLSPVPS